MTGSAGELGDLSRDRKECRVQRRLAAIMFADVVGFSRMMEADEAGTLATIERHLDGVIKPSIRTHGGRIANVAGDGYLILFPSALAAVSSAIEIQAGMRKRNRGSSEARRVEFRIGVHLSEIYFKGKDVVGDGINVTSRIQALAEPGEIYVTDAIETQVRGKIDAAFHDLGWHTLRNIAQPVHVLAVTKAGEQPGKPVAAASRQAQTKASVAVLPFLSLSSDPDAVYFADGFAEDLITALSRFRTISVIARNSSFVYREKSVDVRKVGRELGVQFVIEGSMRRRKEATRITVQLVDAVSAHHVWAESYDTPTEQVFEVQDDVIRSIVGRLIPRMEEQGLEIARKRPAADAYYHYLRGKALLYDQLDERTIAEAREHLEKAVALDPDFAAAYCYLAMICNTLTMHVSPGQALDQYRDQAWRYAKRAAQCDDAHAHTHTTLAWCHLWRGEFDMAHAHVKRAEALNPNDADQTIARGLALVFLGEPEAGIACIQTAIRLNPFHSDYYLEDLAEAYYVARRYREMIEIAERVPDLWVGWVAWKAAGYAQAGDLVRARALARQFVDAIRPVWAGRVEAGVADYVDWVVSFSPFRRAQDRAHFLEGLARAGLPAKPALAVDNGAASRNRRRAAARHGLS